MMISKTMNEKLNEQVMHELHAALVYLDLSCPFAEMGLNVFAEWFRHHAMEERQHAMKIFSFIHEVGGTVKMSAIPAPPKRPSSTEDIVKLALEHELLVTRQINDLMALAEKESDYATRSFLQWFVDEQVEEVAVVNELLQLMKLADGKNLLQVESRVAKMLEREGS